MIRGVLLAGVETSTADGWRGVFGSIPIHGMRLEGKEPGRSGSNPERSIMKIREISIRVGRTVMPEPYHPVRCDIELKAELEPNEDWDEAVEQLYNDARRKLVDKIERLIS